MKKIISFVVCLCLLLTSGVSALADEPLTITFWYSLSGSSGEVVKSIVEAYNASQNKYYVDAQYQGTYTDSLMKFKGTPASALPDVYQINAETTQFMAESSLILPVQQFMDAEGYDNSGMRSIVRAYYSFDGSLYCMPISCSIMCVNYNATIFEQAGIDPSTILTMDDLFAAGDKCVEMGLCTYGCTMENDGWSFEQLMSMQLAHIVDAGNGREGRATRCVLKDSDAALKVLAFHQEFCSDTHQNLKLSSNSECFNEFSAGNAAMMIGSTSCLIKYEKAFAGAWQNEQFALPFLNEGDAGSITPGGNALWITNTGDTAKEAAAWDFIKFCMEPEWVATLAANTGYLPMTEAGYEHEIYQAVLAKHPSVAQMNACLANAKPEACGAVIGVFDSVREIVVSEINHLADDATYTPAETQDVIVDTVNEAIELYNLSNPI